MISGRSDQSCVRLPLQVFCVNRFLYVSSISMWFDPVV